MERSKKSYQELKAQWELTGMRRHIAYLIEEVTGDGYKLTEEDKTLLKDIYNMILYHNSIKKEK